MAGERREDKFLIIATDGLWDSVENDEALRVAGFEGRPAEALAAHVRPCGSLQSFRPCPASP